MLTLYYSKGSSALAAHILLEDIKAEYTAIEVSISEEAHHNPDFLALNPKGRIPLLVTEHGPLSENPAILEYIAARYPEAGYLPKGEFDLAQARSLAAYLCSTVHVAFAHLKRGSRWAREARSISDMQQVAAQNLLDCAAYLENQLSLAPWALGAQFTYCDPYLFQVGRWMAGASLTLDGFPRLQAHHAAMMARPATLKVLEHHDLV